jgi:hypothetical protein
MHARAYRWHPASGQPRCAGAGSARTALIRTDLTDTEM